MSANTATCRVATPWMLTALFPLFVIPGIAEAEESIARYDVTWQSPSTTGPQGSMPLGNGDIGLNAWVEPSGELIFYISKTDSWGDNGRLLKVGRVRFKFDPNLLGLSNVFRQTLHLRDATIEVGCGQGDQAVTVRLWVDANHPVIHVQADSKRPVIANASIELWRKEHYELPSIEVSDLHFHHVTRHKGHFPTFVEPDTVLKDQAGRIGWYHHNAKSVGPAMTAKIQGLTGFERPDPLLHRTFGAVVQAAGSRRVDDLNLQLPASTSHRFSIYVLTKHPASPRQWLDAMDQLITATEKLPSSERRQAHEAWWREFWNRSWIHVAGGEKELNDDAFVVSRAYALQRFVTACAGRGAYPIKFNGSIFTVAYPGKPGDADYRRWGPGYWWQNTRLPYISVCSSGDFDLMQPLLRMYATDVLPVCRYRTRLYCGHDGAFIPECIYFWGDVFSETYGWTPFEKRGEDKLQQSGWHKWEWVSGPELVWMMLDYYEHTLDEAFLKDMLLPTAHEILTFFHQHYKVGEDGKLVMHPSQAVETWWDCTNPMPELAGLHALSDRLLLLPQRLTTAEQRAFWSALRKKLPELPTRQVNGVHMLAPATKFANKRNIENPELYAVFPFRLVSFERPNVKLGIEALKHRPDKGNIGWRQDDIFMAYLGLGEDARQYLVGRARNKHAGSRFPAFWGPNYDWIPDQTHGGVLMKTLQAMLMQTDGEKIYLLPAWPKDWDVDFKLHAPYRTTVQCEYRDGKIQRFSVTPTERRNDVIVPETLR